MTFLELLEESSASLTVNKIRTGLAMLGVIIGIGSVIALMSLGQASQKSVTDRITSLGTNLLTINPGFSNIGGVQGVSGSSASLTLDDVAALENSPLITTLSLVSPSVSQNSQLIAGRNNMNASVVGVTDTYQKVNNLTLSAGMFINERHNTSLSRVVILGPNVVTELFGEGAEVIGQKVRIEEQSFTVIGVTETKTGVGRNSPDDSVFVPLNTAMKVLYGLDSLSTISVTTTSEKTTDIAIDQITQLLMQRHGISNEDEVDFRIFSQEDLLETVTEVTGTFTTLLAGIAAISLVVGGIGIMNIMLVSVTERTREIGLRKALGAQKEMIIGQFLIETIMITVLGGIIGIALGISVSLVIAHFMSLPFVISFFSVGLAFGVSTLIGIIFGLYPAKKAAELQPIEALRYE